MFPNPRTGASLILSFRLASRGILIIGSGPLAASRAFAALEADASHVYILAKGGLRSACEEIQWRVRERQLEFIDWDQLVDLDAWLTGRTDIALACITDTLLGSPLRSRASTEELYILLQKHRIPVNTTDTPDLCNYSFTSSHRFLDPTTGEPTPLQVGVTTNGEGCRLASRITREVVARLPKDVGCAVQSVGRMRRLAKSKTMDDTDADEVSAEDSGVLTPNRPVEEPTLHRLKWVAQVSEYWPLSKLATLSEEEMLELTVDKPLNPPTIHSLSPTPKPGRIVLLGSGPGHPALLTLLTHQILTTHADLVLADKLVPQGVLDLIPSKAELVIAKKFPGNADKSQEEMMDLAVQGARKGLCVVRVCRFPLSLCLVTNNVYHEAKTRRSLYIRPLL
jgi:uroporphyrin-III C-methyltransferase